MTDYTENRNYYRRNSLIIAKYITANGKYHGVLTDISAGGVFVRSINIPVVGQAMTLIFSLFRFDENTSIVGTVTRIQENGFAVKFDEPIEMLAREANELPPIVSECDR